MDIAEPLSAAATSSAECAMMGCPSASVMEALPHEHNCGERVGELDKGGVDDESDDSDDDCTPFEWLTSPSSLKPLIILHALTPQSHTPVASSAHDTNTDHFDYKQRTNRGRALHVGSGSSTLGEFLIEDLGYDLVVNIDKDVETLKKMERRWQRRQRRKTQENAFSSTSISDKSCNDGKLGQLDFVPFDFNAAPSEAISPEAAQSDITQPSSSTDWSYPDASFDLVLDKSTLDCTLCSDDATASLLGLVYRSLRPGGTYMLISFHALDLLLPLLANLPGAEWEVTCTAMQRQAESLDTIRQKQRAKMKAKNQKCRPTKEQPIGLSQPISSPQLWHNSFSTPSIASTAATTHDGDSKAPPPVVLAATTNRADSRRLLNVLIARKKNRTNRFSTGEGAAASESRSVRPSHVLRHDALVRHVHEVNRIWFQKHNPLVTCQREEALLQGFKAAGSPGDKVQTSTTTATTTTGALRNLDKTAKSTSTAPAASTSHTKAQADCTRHRTASCLTQNVTGNNPSRRSQEEGRSNNNTLMLDLPQAYQILFTSAEREHLTYPHFLEDWNAFLEMPQYSQLPRDKISCETAVAFLKEMQ